MHNVWVLCVREREGERGRERGREGEEEEGERETIEREKE